MEPSRHLFGSAVVAMTGLGCIAIATDKRYGSESLTVSSDAPKVFQLGPQLFAGFAGLYSDALTLYEEIRARMYLHDVTTKSKMTAKSVTGALSALLFEKRFANYMIDAVVASLESPSPFVVTLDGYGFPSVHKKFAACGSCRCQLLGLCETFWQPKMEPSELFDVISQITLNSTDRDPLSGCGVVVHMMMDHQTIIRTLKTRMD